MNDNNNFSARESSFDKKNSHYIEIEKDVIQDYNLKTYKDDDMINYSNNYTIKSDLNNNLNNNTNIFDCKSERYNSNLDETINNIKSKRTYYKPTKYTALMPNENIFKSAELIRIKVLEIEPNQLIDFFYGCESKIHFFKLFFNDRFNNILDKIPI